MTDFGGQDSEASAFETDQALLSKRVRMLVDLWELEHNSTFKFPSLSDFLSSEGISVSRPRWSYLLNGNAYLVTDRELLTAIARFFNVTPEFLTDIHSDAPPEITAKIDFLKGLRESQVERFAARALSGISPETLKLVLGAIRSSREKRTKDFDENASGA